jgi:hypothetical protein
VSARTVGRYRDVFDDGHLYGRHARVGSFLGFHTREDGERAREQIASGFKALQDEVMHAAGYSADPYRAASGSIWEWWKVAGIPVVSEWQKFYADQSGSYLSRLGAGWEVFESWQTRLAALRDQAKQHLGHLVSPDPQPLPQTAVDKIGDVAGGLASTLGTVGKVALYAAVGLGAAWGVAEIVKTVRGR